MQLKFEVIVEEAHEHEDLIPFTNALQRDMFLFQLWNNFWKKWKHSEVEPTMEEIKEALFELKNEYGVI